MSAVPITVRLSREQLETAERLASQQNIRCQTLLKKIIKDGLQSLERSIRLRDWR
jgi:hypothetical protein